ncbi:WD40/YVTN repeat-like-containing domain,WD40 repeat,WD40-repeat-containing domain [Cinara cedri]|uniref:Protein SEC13 homolog n=1 Tax=Cinara cedri TaxID=506608 RepID=A0A5E4MLL0_9HEMI|nr:WD40/YVTN repeat-like-containing domain,WD40 repeat,WD40-repeat-containing domain [Cinara cedri]
MKMVPMNDFILNEHEGEVHDAELDYYGQRLATCSSDKTIKIYNIQNGTKTLLADIKGHLGPVWQICWSHPVSGHLLASCSYDKRVVVWKESNDWFNIFEFTHESSVNSVAWAPHQHGIILASASSDGSIGIHVFNKEWSSVTINAHSNGCNSIAWAPFKEQLFGSNQPEFGKKLALASGGCDKLIKIWTIQSDQWVQIGEINCHTDWIRAIDWTCTIGDNRQLIASCSEDKTVVVSHSDDYAKWNSTQMQIFDSRVWTVSWSKIGNVLAVSTERNKVSLWKENRNGQWMICSKINDNKEDN